MRWNARREALVALPWEDFLVPVFEMVAAQKRDWRHVTFLPTHDRLVAVDNERSLVAKLARMFLPKGARVLPLGSENPDYKLAGNAADARLQDLGWPLDLVLLSLDEDGAAAGLVAGPDLDEAMESPENRRAVGIRSQAGEELVTISAHTVASSRTLMFALEGEDRQRHLENAANNEADNPVSRLLAKVSVPVDAHILRT